MIRVTILGTGSRGNAILVETRETTILVDVGFGPRALAQRLALAGCRPENIHAVLLTHEHVDHAQGAAKCCARWQWPLYATAGTLQAIADVLVPTIAIPASTGVAVGGLTVTATPVPHDAREPVAYAITDRASGCRAGIAMDLGHVPGALVPAFEKLDVLVIESNHDARMLVEGPYPWELKRRISSEVGHLSNDQSAAFAAQCAHGGLGAVVLAHLSETNNAPEVAVACMTRALRKSGWRRERVWAGHQLQVRGPYAPRDVVAGMRTEQLGLAL